MSGPLPPSLTLCIPPSCRLQSHPKSIPCTQVHISRRCSPRNQTSSACRRFWSSSKRLAPELFREPDAVLGAGAAELPAGHAGADTHTSHHSTGCTVRLGLCGRPAGLRASSPERLHWGWQEEHQEGASRVDERLAEEKEVEPSSKQTKQHEWSQDIL